MIVGEIDDVKACPAVLAVSAWAAPQAICSEGDLTYAVYGVLCYQAALQQFVGRLRRVTEQHKSVRRQIDHTPQALASVQLKDF